MGKFQKTLISLPDWAKDVISLTAFNLTIVLAIAVVGGSSFCLITKALPPNQQQSLNK